MTRQTTIQTDEGAPRRSLQIEERTDAQVEALIAWGYAQNLTEVVRHAIREAWERQITYQEAQEMAEGFDLKTASVAIRKCAEALGIKSGRWEPVNADRPVDVLEDDAVVARVWNSRKPKQDITAFDVHYAQQYLI